MGVIDKSIRIQEQLDLDEMLNDLF